MGFNGKTYKELDVFPSTDYTVGLFRTRPHRQGDCQRFRLFGSTVHRQRLTEVIRNVFSAQQNRAAVLISLRSNEVVYYIRELL